MYQLSALENLMIEGELPNLPMNMSALLIYDTGGVRRSRKLFHTLQSGLEEIIDVHFPVLRCRLESLPLQIDKCYWVEDPDFSPAYHISRVALPKSQNWQELYTLFSQFHGRPLDHSRPLWEVLYVEGLDNLEGVPKGSSALFLKIHHAVLDGKGAQRLMSSFHSLSPEQGAPVIADSFTHENRKSEDFKPPGALSKYSRAWWHGIERPVDLIATLAKLLPGWLQGKSADTGNTSQATPHTYFNQVIDADRVIGHVRMELRQLKKLEAKYHCTVNDIAICVVAGALCRFLLERDDLPAEDLQSIMPVNIRHKKEDGKVGNHISAAKMSLYTSERDPGKRLQAIHADTQNHKRRIRKGGPTPVTNLMDDIHPAIILFLGRWLVSSGHLDDLPQAANTVITNVPGIPHDAYLDGVKLIDYLGFGPLAPNMGLFHTVSSTEDHVNVSFLSTERFVGDGKGYVEALTESWREVARLTRKR